MTRLSKEDWDKLDDLIGQHGFGGYYDLVECLKMVAGDLGVSGTEVDLMDIKTLPEVVDLLMVWAGVLSHTEGFTIVAEKATKKE